jgi:small subunit ribosomal protein S16
MGTRNRPYYRVVAAEDSMRRDGRFIEILGTYDPLKKPASIDVRSDAVLKWLANGAQPSDTVKRILAKTGVWAHWRAVQQGQAELSALTEKRAGTVERPRARRPSKKAAAKIGKAEGAEA